jgi:hypothetical protein
MFIIISASEIIVTLCLLLAAGQGNDIDGVPLYDVTPRQGSFIFGKDVNFIVFRFKK